MKAFPSRRIALVLGGLVGVITLLVLVDLGISAGRIHHGVFVDRIDVGGMTEVEAARTLRVAARAYRREPLVLITEGLTYPTLPARVGWEPRPAETASRAMRVGRTDLPLGALADRLEAWIGKVVVEWVGGIDPVKLGRVVDDVERRVAALGTAIDRDELIRRIERTVAVLPRAPVEIPIAHD
ncbi:MAG: hypothetical protein ACRDKB_09075 [Actinomycetota bacterium]